MEKLQIAVCGDIMLGGPEFENKLKDKSEIFSADIKKWLSEKDIVHANMEMALTHSNNPGPRIFNFKMNPAYTAVFSDLGIDHLSLSNNHIADFGDEGIAESIKSLQTNAIKFSGYKDKATEFIPAELGNAHGKVSIFSLLLGEEDDLRDFEPLEQIACLILNREISENPVFASFIEQIKQHANTSTVLLSLHFLGDFVPQWKLENIYTQIAHQCIDAGALVVHFHGAHHILGIERYQQGVIIYGLGPFIDDYGCNLQSLKIYQRYFPTIIPEDFTLNEDTLKQWGGTFAHPIFRTDLGMLAAVEVKDRKVVNLELFPVKVEKLKLVKAGKDDITWMLEKLKSLSTNMNIQIKEDRIFCTF